MTARTTKATIQSALAQVTMVALTTKDIAQTLEPSCSLHEAPDGDVPTINEFDAKCPQSPDPKKKHNAHCAKPGDTMDNAS